MRVDSRELRVRIDGQWTSLRCRKSRRRQVVASVESVGSWTGSRIRAAGPPGRVLQRRRGGPRAEGRERRLLPDVLLLLCEHPHVITLGRNGKLANLRASDHVLRQMGVSFFETDRGGDITYHGPGQLVGYPILNLARDPARRRLVCAQPRGSHDPRHGRIRRRLAARSRTNGRVGGCPCRIRSCRGRKTGRHRRAPEPLGHLARFCVQCVDGPALFRSDRAVRDCREAGDVPRKIAGRGAPK